MTDIPFRNPFLTYKHAGAEWIEDARKYWPKAKNMALPISDLGRDVADMLGEIYAGIYHLNSRSLSKADWTDNKMIVLILQDYGEFGTYDSSNLTYLVIMAHLLNIKVVITACAPNYLRLIFIRIIHKHHRRDNHPTLDEPIKRCQTYLANILASREAEKPNE